MEARDKEIELLYGDGFVVRNYRLKINDEYFTLGEGLGTEKEQEQAKIKATEILQVKGIKFDLNTVDFKWDGTM